MSDSASVVGSATFDDVREAIVNRIAEMIRVSAERNGSRGCGVRGKLGRSILELLNQRHGVPLEDFTGASCPEEWESDLAEEFVLQRDVDELFSGGSRGERAMRESFLFEVDVQILWRVANEEILDKLAIFHGRYDIKSENPEELEALKSELAYHLARRSFHAGQGKPWATKFVRLLGLPDGAAGAKLKPKPQRFEDIDAIVPPQKLQLFQDRMKTRMLEVLNRDSDKSRCMISLPTGCGKTRIAVEAVLDYLGNRLEAGAMLIWIVQQAELAEQAIQCIIDLWRIRKNAAKLRVYRFYEGNDFTLDDVCGGVLVASIQQIASRVETCPFLREIIRKSGAIVIDEAHRASSESYRALFFDHLPEIRGKRDLPIIGLSATPGLPSYRKGGDGTTDSVAQMFDYNLITPDVPSEYNGREIAFFQNEGVLAHVDPEVIDTKLDFDDAHETYDEWGKAIDSKCLAAIGENRGRNERIIERLKKIAKEEPTLIFACNVKHIYRLVSLLRAEGLLAEGVSGETSDAKRHRSIIDFKTGHIQFLVNYSVLTTGFDAPKIRNIVICRPIISDVLYEQIIGRGLRGRLFGGTERCTIIDFSDTLGKFGKPLSYARHASAWKASV